MGNHDGMNSDAKDTDYIGTHRKGRRMRKLILAAGAAVALAAGSAGTALALSGSNAQMLKGTQYFCVNTGSMGSGDGTPQGYKEIRNVPHGCTRGHILTPVVPDPEPTPTPTATATVPVK